jgi:hypothetical protein
MIASAGGWLLGPTKKAKTYFFLAFFFVAFFLVAFFLAFFLAAIFIFSFIGKQSQLPRSLQ